MLGSKYEVFLCVAKWGSFSRAAEELFLTQPAVTRQIKALEEELGFALFTRSRNSIRLTRAGKSLAGSLAGIRDIADKALREASDIADGKLTSIALGYATPYSTYWLPGALRRLYAIRQATNVRLFKDRSVKLVDKLVTGEIDAAVVSQADLRDTGIPSRHVCTSRPYAYVSADSPLASLEAVSLEDLRQERILAPASSASSDVIHLGIRNLMASGLSMEEFTLVDSPESGCLDGGRVHRAEPRAPRGRRRRPRPRPHIGEPAREREHRPVHRLRRPHPGPPGRRPRGMREGRDVRRIRRVVNPEPALRPVLELAAAGRAPFA